MSRKKHTVQLPGGSVQVEDHGDIDPADQTMTDAEIDQTVAEVNASPEHRRRVADAVEQAKRGRGRPPLSSEPTERVGLRVTRRQRVELDRIAHREHRRISAVVRDAVDEYLDRRAS